MWKLCELFARDWQENKNIVQFPYQNSRIINTVIIDSIKSIVTVCFVATYDEKSRDFSAVRGSVFR